MTDEDSNLRLTTFTLAKYIRVRCKLTPSFPLLTVVLGRTIRPGVPDARRIKRTSGRDIQHARQHTLRPLSFHILSGSLLSPRL